MKRTRIEPVDDQSHVFDQTNGLVDFGDEKPTRSDDTDDTTRVIYGSPIQNPRRSS